MSLQRTDSKRQVTWTFLVSRQINVLLIHDKIGTCFILDV